MHAWKPAARTSTTSAGRSLTTPSAGAMFHAMPLFLGGAGGGAVCTVEGRACLRKSAVALSWLNGYGELPAEAMAERRSHPGAVFGAAAARACLPPCAPSRPPARFARRLLPAFRTRPRLRCTGRALQNCKQASAPRGLFLTHTNLVRGLSYS